MEARVFNLQPFWCGGGENKQRYQPRVITAAVPPKTCYLAQALITPNKRPMPSFRIQQNKTKNKQLNFLNKQFIYFLNFHK